MNREQSELRLEGMNDTSVNPLIATVEDEIASKGRRSLLVWNRELAQQMWSGPMPGLQLEVLDTLSRHYRLSIAAGDLQVLDSRWYVTHTGLLRTARRLHCAGIRVAPVARFCNAAARRWLFEATVYTSEQCKGFIGFGDADPNNVSLALRGAEARIAETRAVNRALRKAYGIGICSVEEIGNQGASVSERFTSNRKATAAGSLRDRLRQIIRCHQLDPAQVKLYAAEYCGVSELRQANRSDVAELIEHLARAAEQDRAGLLCSLNRFAPRSVTNEANQHPLNPESKPFEGVA